MTHSVDSILFCPNCISISSLRSVISHSHVSFVSNYINHAFCSLHSYTRLLSLLLQPIQFLNDSADVLSILSWCSSCPFVCCARSYHMASPIFVPQYIVATLALVANHSYLSSQLHHLLLMHHLLIQLLLRPLQLPLPLCYAAGSAAMHSRVCPFTSVAAF